MYTGSKPFKKQAKLLTWCTALLLGCQLAELPTAACTCKQNRSVDREQLLAAAHTHTHTWQPKTYTSKTNESTKSSKRLIKARISSDNNWISSTLKLESYGKKVTSKLEKTVHEQGTACCWTILCNNISNSWCSWKFPLPCRCSARCQRPAAPRRSKPTTKGTNLLLLLSTWTPTPACSLLPWGRKGGSLPSLQSCWRMACSGPCVRPLHTSEPPVLYSLRATRLVAGPWGIGDRRVLEAPLAPLLASAPLPERSRTENSNRRKGKRTKPLI